MLALASSEKSWDALVLGGRREIVLHYATHSYTLQTATLFLPFAQVPAAPEFASIPELVAPCIEEP